LREIFAILFIELDGLFNDFAEFGKNLLGIRPVQACGRA
jgi:hypothetical protein